jgi:ClpP class serine protease
VARIRLLAAKKPVVASMGDVAASGELLWPWAVEDRRRASHVTGSIGVVGAFPDQIPDHLHRSV